MNKLGYHYHSFELELQNLMVVVSLVVEMLDHSMKWLNAVAVVVVVFDLVIPTLSHLLDLKHLDLDSRFLN